MGVVGGRAPLDLVNLLLDLQAWGVGFGVSKEGRREEGREGGKRYE